MTQQQEGNKGFVLATMAGTCAGLASVFGKLAVDGQWIRQGLSLLQGISEEYNTPHATASVGLEPMMGLNFSGMESALRGLCFASVFVCNMVMWNLFVKSMNFSSSVMATVVNSATNFFSSALLGHLLFAEPLPPSWWLGSGLIIAGLFFLAAAGASPDAAQKSKTD